MKQRLVIEAVKETFLFNVAVDGRFMADQLSRDEALGCVASWLYGERVPSGAVSLRLSEGAAELARKEGMIR